ncbi:MAG: hypothetical protein Q7U74_07250, partial [Saprospiraceae bacterium]|nr:hypothetical protein [Saprospiraceae bacterium]
MIKVFELPNSSDCAYSAARILVTSDIREFNHFWPSSNGTGSARCYVYQCSELIELYCKAVVPARQGEPYFVAVMNKNDEPLVLLPVTIERRLTVRVLRFIDGGLSDENAPVLFERVRSWGLHDMLFVWNALRGILRFDIAIFEKMPAYVDDLPNPLVG